jgi:hypothetical protein
MRAVRGRIHGRDPSDLPRVLAAVSALPGYEATGEESPGGWQVSYVTQVATAAGSWEACGRALAAAGAA